MAASGNPVRYHPEIKDLRKQWPTLLVIGLIFTTSMLYFSELHSASATVLSYTLLSFPVVFVLTLLSVVPKLNYVQFNKDHILITWLGFRRRTIRWSDIERAGVMQKYGVDGVGIDYRSSADTPSLGRKIRRSSIGWDDFIPNFHSADGTPVTDVVTKHLGSKIDESYSMKNPWFGRSKSLRVLNIITIVLILLSVGFNLFIGPKINTLILGKHPEALVIQRQLRDALPEKQINVSWRALQNVDEDSDDKRGILTVRASGDSHVDDDAAVKIQDIVCLGLEVYSQEYYDAILHSVIEKRHSGRLVSEGTKSGSLGCALSESTQPASGDSIEPLVLYQDTSQSSIPLVENVKPEPQNEEPLDPNARLDCCQLEPDL